MIGIDADNVQQAFGVPRKRHKDSHPREIVVILTTRYDKFNVLEKSSSLTERGNIWNNEQEQIAPRKKKKTGN